MQNRAQHLAQSGAAGNDIVVRAKDNRLFDEADRQSLKEGGQVAAGVDAHMGGQAVAPGARQVIDQGDIAKAVGPAPLDPVGLEGVTPVGDKNHHPPARFQQPDHFSDRLAVVADVFQHLMA